jgi:hypothetical protein
MTLLQIPCIIWLMMRKPQKYGLSWTINIVSFSHLSTLRIFYCRIIIIIVNSFILVLINTVHVLFALFVQICIVVGVCLTVIAPIGGMRQIIHDVKTFKFYA